MIKYAKGPVSFLYKDVKVEKTGRIRRKKVKQILWGDWIRIQDNDSARGWLNVKYGRSSYLMREKDLQRQRVLEIIFLDVGQGDGCIVTEPGEHETPRIMVIDAGVGRNMIGFLRWRFRDFRHIGNIHAAVITHPDKDHYYGFSKVFSNKKFKIEHVYHNGIIERTGEDRLGPACAGYLTDIRGTNTEARKLVCKKANRGRMRYPNLIKKALDAKHICKVEALTTMHGTVQNGKTWVPGYEPSAAGDIEIEVLGPVIEKDANGKARLRQFGSTPYSTTMNVGKTKNGHSVLLRLEYNGFRVLLGGDLNLPAENFLMLWYGNEKNVPSPLSGSNSLLKTIGKKTVIDCSRTRFEADLMKTCHHGSSDVSNEFLCATNACAYVVSSGDQESHVHPRPDLLGLLGKVGRGTRPLLLSTELLRSTREREDSKLRVELIDVTKKIETELTKEGGGNRETLKTLKAKRKRIRDQIFKRNVGVYGAINLRTDGEKAVIAFRKETYRPTSRWFFYELERDSTGGYLPVLKRR